MFNRWYISGHWNDYAVGCGKCLDLCWLGEFLFRKWDMRGKRVDWVGQRRKKFGRTCVSRILWKVEQDTGKKKGSIVCARVCGAGANSAIICELPLYSPVPRERSSCLNCSPRGGLTHTGRSISLLVYNWAYSSLRPSYSLTYVNSRARSSPSSPRLLSRRFATWTYGGCLWLTLKSCHRHSGNSFSRMHSKYVYSLTCLSYSAINLVAWCFHPRVCVCVWRLYRVFDNNIINNTIAFQSYVIVEATTQLWKRHSAALHFRASN